jgi:hypothetical protein
MIPLLYYACTLKAFSTDEWSVVHVLKLLFSPLKIYSLYSIRKQSKYSSSKVEFGNVQDLSGLSSDLSEKHLIYYLESPDFFVRSRALRRMDNLELSEKSLRIVYKYIKNHTDLNLPLAVGVLARNNFNKALPLLRSRLNADDEVLVCSSMLGLVKLKDMGSYNRIIEIFKTSENLRIVCYAVRSLALMNDDSTLSCLLEKLTFCTSSKQFFLVDEIVLTISSIISCNEVYYIYERIYQYNKNQGLLGLIDILDNNKAFGLSSIPESILIYYYKDRSDPDRKLRFINYLKEALERDIPKMKELIIFKDYFLKTESSLISGKLMAAIFIKLFCKNECIDDYKLS